MSSDLAFILAAKQRDAESDTTEREWEIDRLLYGSYGLTPAERDLVEERAEK